MKNRARITIVVGATVIALVAAFSFQKTATNDPFANFLAVLTLPDFQRGALIGDVEEYDAPLFFEPLPDVDWGDASASFRVSFPIEDTLAGRQRSRRLDVSCVQASSQAVFAQTTSPMLFNLAPEIMGEAQRLSLGNAGYIRHCTMQIWMRDHEEYRRIKGVMHHRCTDVIRSEFGSATKGELAENNTIFIVKSATPPVEREYGTLIGAYCAQLQTLAGPLQFHAWFRPN